MFGARVDADEEAAGGDCPHTNCKLLLAAAQMSTTLWSSAASTLSLGFLNRVGLPWDICVAHVRGVLNSGFEVRCLCASHCAVLCLQRPRQHLCCMYAVVCHMHAQLHLRLHVYILAELLSLPRVLPTTMCCTKCPATCIATCSAKAG